MVNVPLMLLTLRHTMRKHGQPTRLHPSVLGRLVHQPPVRPTALQRRRGIPFSVVQALRKTQPFRTPIILVLCHGGVRQSVIIGKRGGHYVFLQGPTESSQTFFDL